MIEKTQSDIQHIRSMMERSSRFISLSGWSGVVAGILGLIGCAMAHYWLHKDGVIYASGKSFQLEKIWQLSILAAIILMLAISFALFFTFRKSKKQQIPIYTKSTFYLLLHLHIPLFIGGVVILALLKYSYFGMIAPTTLIFYGLALINASKYTYGDVFYLGLCEAALGLIALFLPGYGLYFLATGFGVLHIIYGVIMQRKYQ